MAEYCHIHNVPLIQGAEEVWHGSLHVGQSLYRYCPVCATIKEEEWHKQDLILRYQKIPKNFLKIVDFADFFLRAEATCKRKIASLRQVEARGVRSPSHPDGGFYAVLPYVLKDGEAFVGDTYTKAIFCDGGLVMTYQETPAEGSLGEFRSHLEQKFSMEIKRWTP